MLNHPLTAPGTWPARPSTCSRRATAARCRARRSSARPASPTAARASGSTPPPAPARPRRWRPRARTARRTRKSMRAPRGPSRRAGSACATPASPGGAGGARPRSRRAYLWPGSFIRTSSRSGPTFACHFGSSAGALHRAPAIVDGALDVSTVRRHRGWWSVDVLAVRPHATPQRTGTPGTTGIPGTVVRFFIAEAIASA